jgi:exportin-T
MVAVWGGPNVQYWIEGVLQQPVAGVPSAQPTLPGFDNFAISRFSPLTWAVPAAQGFNAKDPQARQVLAEAASLQMEILRKTGNAYVDALRTELGAMGVGNGDVEGYVATLVRGGEKEFKSFFMTFVGR